jgi:hypothetical protein
MCDVCDDLTRRIERYGRLAKIGMDDLTRDRIVALIDHLQRRKDALGHCPAIVTKKEGRLR